MLMLSRVSVCLPTSPTHHCAFLISKCLQLPRKVGLRLEEEEGLRSSCSSKAQALSAPFRLEREAAHPPSPVHPGERAVPHPQGAPVPVSLCCPVPNRDSVTHGLPLPSCASRGPMHARLSAWSLGKRDTLPLPARLPSPPTFHM